MSQRRSYGERILDPCCGASPRLGARGAPQAGELAPGLRLVRHDLENAKVLLRGGGPVPGLGGGAGQAEARLDVAGVLAEWGTCAQT